MPIDIQPAWFCLFWSPAGVIFNDSASHLIPVNFATRIALLFFFALLHSAELPAHFGIGRVAPRPAWSLVRTKVKVAAVIMVPDVRKIVSLRILNRNMRFRDILIKSAILNILGYLKCHILKHLELIIILFGKFFYLFGIYA